LKPELLAYYTGNVRSLFSGRAADPAICANASSGGIVTGLFAGMLARGDIDAALVWQLEIQNGAMRAVPVFARNAEELRRAQDSIYFAFPPLETGLLRRIRAFEGRLAVVGLPCTVRALRRMMEKEPELKEKIVLLVGLFCGHTSRPEQIETVLAKKGVVPSQLNAFRFRRGLWRGEAEAVMADGTRRSWPTASYKLYQNLFIQCHAPCLSCFDHFAEEADLSCGDIWMKKHRNDKVKHSVVAGRTGAGIAALEAAREAGDLLLQPEPPELLFDSNRRAAVFHKAVRARSLVGRWVGLRIPEPESARPARWNELLAAMMIVPLYRFSIGRHGKILYRLPRIVLKGWLYGFKALTNF